MKSEQMESKDVSLETALKSVSFPGPMDLDDLCWESGLPQILFWIQKRSDAPDNKTIGF